MREPVRLVTSIAPRNIENQQRAIASWMRFGFAVTSINVPSEVTLLEPQFPSIEFFPVSRDARDECGRPLVYLDDVFDFLRQNGTRICGVINSDIHLRASPQLLPYLMEQATGSMVYFCRTDVAAMENPDGEVYRVGFDMFLFDRAILETLPSTRFCLGQPWWDYWLPSSLLKTPRKFPLKFAAFPFAYHIKHESNQGGNYVKYGMHFLQCYDPSLYGRFSDQPSEKLHGWLGAYSAQITAMIFFGSTWISYLPPNDSSVGTRSETDPCWR